MKRWYEIIPQFLKEIPIDIEPMIWFFMSSVLIFAGHYCVTNEKTTAGILLAALGGAGIARVRGSRKDPPPAPPV